MKDSSLQNEKSSLVAGREMLQVYICAIGGNEIKHGQLKCLQFGRVSKRFCHFEILWDLRCSTQANAANILFSFRQFLFY
jgi:hypothetical protein